MGIMIKDFVHACHTNQEGDLIFNQIAPLIFKNQSVTLSFKGINSVTSSFINSAFIPLMETVSYDHIKKYLRIIDSNKFINDTIVNRLKQEENCVMR
jgi:hypothetical protein